jgi:hypothetical protein
MKRRMKSDLGISLCDNTNKIDDFPFIATKLFFGMI